MFWDYTFKYWWFCLHRNANNQKRSSLRKDFEGWCVAVHSQHEESKVGGEEGDRKDGGDDDGGDDGGDVVMMMMLVMVVVCHIQHEDGDDDDKDYKKSIDRTVVHLQLVRVVISRKWVNRQRECDERETMK